MATAERTRSNPMDSQGFSENEKMDTHQMGSTQMSSQQDSRIQNTLFQVHDSTIDQNMGSQTQGQSGSKRSQRQNNKKGGSTFSMTETIRRTQQVIKEENPSRSRQSGSRIQDFEDDKTDYDELSSEKRKNKVMKMIKNSHIEKIKNYIYLKEIDNAYDEMIRLRASGDMASSKEMERELNSLTKDIIISNLDAFNKTQMAKSHAMSRTSGAFSSQYSDSQKGRGQRDIRRSQQDRMYKTVTSTTRVVNRHTEDNNEEEDQYEEEEKSEKKKRQKKKNKSIKDNNMKKRKNKSRPKTQYNNHQYDNNPNNPNNNQYGYNPNYNQYGYNPNNPNNSQFGYNPNNPNDRQFGYNPNNPNDRQFGYNPNDRQFGYNPNDRQFGYNPNSNDPNYNQNNNGPNPNQYYNPNNNGPNNNPYYNQNYQDQNYNQSNFPNNRDQSYNDPKYNNQYQNPKSSSPDNQNPMYNPNLSNSSQDNRSVTRAQIMEIPKKDRYNKIFDSQASVDNSTIREFSEQTKDKINPDDRNKPGSSQDRSQSNNDPVISGSKIPFSDEKDQYGSLTQEKIDKVGQELIDQQETYQTVVIGSNNRTNPNPNDPNKIDPSSEVPQTGNEKTPDPNEKEKEQKGEPPASDALHPSSQPYQPVTEAQHQTFPKVLRHPNQETSPPEIEIESNQKPQPNDPSGRETGRFPSSVHNPKLNPDSIPDYPSRYQYQGPRQKKPSPKKTSPNYGPRGYPSKNPQYPYDPRNPPRGNPRYPSRGNPRNPPRGNPRYPSRDNPRNPPRGNPRYPPGDNPRYPPGDNPRYPPGDNPRYPPGDNPRYPPGDYPRDPNYPPNTGLDSGMRRPLSTRGPNPRVSDPSFGYPRRYRDEQRGRGKDITFGESFGRSHSRSHTKSRKQSPVDIPYSYPTGGRCFACDVDCSISRSGNSPNKYVPYFASLKKERKAVTDYDAEKYGYYQYSSTFSKNINNS